jgi:hypothetical protein
MYYIVKNRGYRNNPHENVQSVVDLFPSQHASGGSATAYERCLRHGFPVLGQCCRGVGYSAPVYYVWAIDGPDMN